MEKFNIIVPFEKEVSLDGKMKLFGGIASSTALDRDNERMDKSVLKKISKGLEGATVFFNHKIKELGVGKVYSAEEKGNEVHISVIPTAAKGMSDVITQIEEGILKSFSIGGKILKVENEFDDSLNKEIKVIKDVEIYEVSVVGIPANKEASIQHYISKSFKGDNLPCDKDTSEEGNKKKKTNDDKKEGEDKKAGLLESPEFKKVLSDFREENMEKFASFEKQLGEANEKIDTLENANKALTARNDELHKNLDNRVKSMKTDSTIEKDPSEKKEVKKEAKEEPARFL